MKRLADSFDASGAGRERALECARYFVAALADEGYGDQACAIVLQTLVAATDARIAFETSLRPPSPKSREISDLLQELVRHLEDELRGYRARTDPRPRQRQRGRMLVERLLTALRAYIEHFIHLDGAEQPGKTRRHRPGDREWLEPAVRGLRAVFRMGKDAARSESDLPGMIYRALVAAGHADVLTREKIRHILAPHPAKSRRKRVR